MFTGIIEELGRLKQKEGSPQGGSALVIGASLVLEGLKIGDSIAVNGICLTATEFTRETFTAYVMPETLRKTGLDALTPGSHLNLERALALGGRLGGHMVSGHVDGTGTLTWRRPEGNALILNFKAAPELMRYVIPKGSIAVDGVSLTVAFIDENGFSVSLIPHSADQTTLGRKKPGDLVNLETDLIGKYVEKLLQPYTEKKEEKDRRNSITTAFLHQNGFI